MILWVSNDQVRIRFLGLDHDLTLPGKWRRESSGQRPVAPGDRVIIGSSGSQLKLIDVLPRRNEFTRKVAGQRPLPQVAAANIDQVIVMASIRSPRTAFGLIDRLLVTASIGNVESRLVFNKCDLAGEADLTQIDDAYRSAEVPLHFISLVTGEGVANLVAEIETRSTLLAGQSGVGKSSLANIIEPGLDIRTAEISSSTGKGRHSTTSARMHPLSRGGWLIDTPGLRECAPWGITADSLFGAFAEFQQFAGSCRFRNCRHLNEADCAVKEAVDSGVIPGSRYDSYRKLLSESQLSDRKY